MLLNPRTGIRYEGVIDPLLLTDPSIIFHFTNVIAKDENNNFYVTTYDESKIRNLKIIARVRYAFELNKTIRLQEGCQGHSYKFYYTTPPFFKRIIYKTDTNTPLDIVDNVF